MRDHHPRAVKHLVRLPVVVEREPIRFSLHPVLESIELASLKRLERKVYRRATTV
jgi:hypothetical protein